MIFSLLLRLSTSQKRLFKVSIDTEGTVLGEYSKY